MSNVIQLTTKALDMRDSERDFQARQARIKVSLDSINKLMSELRGMSAPQQDNTTLKPIK
jgi:hypothetical protein